MALFKDDKKHDAKHDAKHHDVKVVVPSDDADALGAKKEKRNEQALQQLSLQHGDASQPDPRTPEHQLRHQQVDAAHEAQVANLNHTGRHETQPGVFKDKASKPLSQDAIGYMVMKDFSSVQQHGQVLSYKKGEILRMPQDTARILLIQNAGGDVQPLRHMETCPVCKSAHPCTLELAAAKSIIERHASAAVPAEPAYSAGDVGAHDRAHVEAAEEGLKTAKK